MADQLIESFKRLYKQRRINEDTLNSLLNKGIINENDKRYIMEKDGE